MGSKDLVLDDCSQWQVVEQVSKHFPCICVLILSDAFVVETVVLSDCPRFVISSQDGDSVFVANFESQEETDSLNGVVASVDIVT